MSPQILWMLSTDTSPLASHALTRLGTVFTDMIAPGLEGSSM